MSGAATIVNRWDPIAPCAAPQTTLPPLLLDVATTLVYVATQGQTLFDLTVPDQFGNKVMLGPDNAVQVFRNGARLAPDDGTGIGGFLLFGNVVTLLWPAGAGEVLVVDVYVSSGNLPELIGPVGPRGPTGPVGPQGTPGSGVAITLVYVATQGQTNFDLTTPDRFGQTVALGPDNAVSVFHTGDRLPPDDGTGMGGFTIAGNVVTLLWPAGAGDTITIDVYSARDKVNFTISTEPLTFASNVAHLTHPADGRMLIIFVGGLAYLAVGVDAAFTVSGSTVTWTGPTISLGNAVAAYTHA